MRILVLGDLCLTGDPEARWGGRPARSPWAGFAPGVLDDSIVVANLECAITDSDHPRPYKWATLRVSPRCMRALEHLHVAVLGNNHISDYGDAGAQETIGHLRRAGIQTVGYGNNLAQAMQPAVVERSQIRLGVLSFSCPTTNGENYATHTSPGVAPLGVEILRRSIAVARPMVDALLVCVHAGCEQSHDPVPDQVRLAHRAVEFGADAVVGSHAHVIQSYECYRGRWILHGLGNFLFGPVQTRQVQPDGSLRQGRQDLLLQNRQSLIVGFSVVPDEGHGRLRVDTIQPVEFADDYVPRPIPRERLTVDLDRINRRLRRYCQAHRRELCNVQEPVLDAVLRHGTLHFFYHTRPINDRAHPLRERLRFGYLGRAARRAQRWLRGPAIRARNGPDGEDRMQ